jgi:hypothetical protein
MHIYRYIKEVTAYVCLGIIRESPYIIKNVVIWDVISCGFFKNRHFGGTCRLHDDDDGGDTFLRNVGYYKSYTAERPRRCHTS